MFDSCALRVAAGNEALQQSVALHYKVIKLYLLFEFHKKVTEF